MSDVLYKRDRFLPMIDQHSPDIIVGTESFLNPHIDNEELFPNMFQMYRHNHPTDSHGSILIAVANSLIATELSST